MAVEKVLASLRTFFRTLCGREEEARRRRRPRSRRREEEAGGGDEADIKPTT